MSESVQVQVDKAALLDAIRHDCVTFFSFYIGEELTLEIPQMHIEVWEELLRHLEELNDVNFIVGHLQKLFAIPRDHSKSTIAKLAIILFMRYSPLRFTLYVSKTSAVASAAMRDVVLWLTSPQEAALYGTPEKVKSNEQEGLWIYNIGLPNGKRKRIILKAIGQQHQVRGTLIDNLRPDFVVIDDIEDYDTADNGVQQQKLDTWTLGSLMKATAKRSFRLFLGNMVKSTTLLARLAKDPAWNPTVFGALVRDKVTKELKALWPGRWTVESLLADYRSHRRNGVGHIWETEMMNLSGDSLLTMNLDTAVLIPLPNPEDLTAGFIVLDPAFGKKSWNDKSALTMHARINEFGIPALIDSESGRWSEAEILDKLIEKSYYWNIATWVIEAAAAQKLFIPLFRLMLIERQIPPDVFTILPISGGTKESKASRIVAFRRAVHAKSYAIAESQIDLKMKLEEYSPDTEDHDDECDSAAFGTLVWATYGETIEAQGIQTIAGRLMKARDMQTQNAGEISVARF